MGALTTPFYDMCAHSGLTELWMQTSPTWMIFSRQHTLQATNLSLCHMVEEHLVGISMTPLRHCWRAMSRVGPCSTLVRTTACSPIRLFG